MSQETDRWYSASSTAATTKIMMLRQHHNVMHQQQFAMAGEQQHQVTTDFSQKGELLQTATVTEESTSTVTFSLIKFVKQA